MSGMERHQLAIVVERSDQRVEAPDLDQGMAWRLKRGGRKMGRLRGTPVTDEKARGFDARIAVVGAAASTAAAFAAATTQWMLMIVASVAGLAALVASPVFVLLLLVVGVEEETLAGGTEGSASPLVRIGSEQLYFRTFGFGITAITVAVIIAAIASRQHNRQHARVVDRPVLVAALLLALYCVFVALAQDVGLSSGLRAARAFVLIAAAGFVGQAAFLNVRWRRRFPLLIAVLLTYKAFIGVTAAARGEVLPGQNLLRLVYYDSALALLAVSCAVGALAARRSGRLSGLIATASVLVLVTGLRRNALAAGVLALVLVPLLMRSGKATARLYGGAFLLLGGVLLLVRDLAARLVDSATQALITLSGAAVADSSTAGHADDIERGWSYAKAFGFWGAGLDHGQLPGLAVTRGGGIYVHNELFHDWLRLGFPAAATVVFLVLLGVLRAVRTFRRHDLDLLEAVAAVFLLVLPVTLWFFPNLSVNQRWPILTGFFLGVLHAAVRNAATTPSSESAAPEGDRETAASAVTAPLTLTSEDRRSVRQCARGSST